MEFEGGLTAAFSMVAFTESICQRKTTIYGSKVGLEGIRLQMHIQPSRLQINIWH